MNRSSQSSSAARIAAFVLENLPSDIHRRIQLLEDFRTIMPAGEAKTHLLAVMVSAKNHLGVVETSQAELPLLFSDCPSVSTRQRRTAR